MTEILDMNDELSMISPYLGLLKSKENQPKLRADGYSHGRANCIDVTSQSFS